MDKLMATDTPSGFSAETSVAETNEVAQTTPEPTPELIPEPQTEPEPEPEQTPPWQQEPQASDITDLPQYLDNGEKLVAAQQIDAWSALIQELDVGGLTKQLLLQSNLISQGEHYRVSIDQANHHLNEQQHVQTIEQALSKYHQKATRFSVEFAQVTNTPFEIQQKISAKRQQYAYQTVQQDEHIQGIIQAFDGKVIDDSVLPR